MKIETRPRAFRRALLAVILGILVLGAVSEAGVRFLLFHESALARKLGAGLRRAWPAGMDLDVELAGVRELELSAELEEGSSGSAWIHLAGARLE